MTPKRPSRPPPSSCCHILARIVDYAAVSPRAVVGLQVGHLFDSTTGQHTWSPVVYQLPSRGRGKEKVIGLTAVMVFCPFCGTKQPGRP